MRIDARAVADRHEAVEAAVARYQAQEALGGVAWPSMRRLADRIDPSYQY